MTNTEYLAVIEFLNRKLQDEISLLRLSGKADSLAEFTSFMGIISSIDVMTILQPNEVSKHLDEINKATNYNEHYYQKLVLDVIVYVNTLDGGWTELADNLKQSVNALKESDFIPTTISERLDIEAITDPYIATLFLIKDSAAATLIKEARRNVK